MGEALCEAHVFGGDWLDFLNCCLPMGSSSFERERRFCLPKDFTQKTGQCLGAKSTRKRSNIKESRSVKHLGW